MTDEVTYDAAAQAEVIEGQSRTSEAPVEEVSDSAEHSEAAVLPR